MFLELTQHKGDKDVRLSAEKNLSPIILDVIAKLQPDSKAWVELAKVGSPLTNAGIQFKQYGYPKLRSFLCEFLDILEFRDEQEGCKPPVYYVRPIPASNSNPSRHGEKIPTNSSNLFVWASIPSKKIDELSRLALEERWYYGETMLEQSDNLPILKSYLRHTFRRLCFENKVLIKTDDRNIEYAAFNTGLVDKKYASIYALFKKNAKPPIENWNPYWYLWDFVVPGENNGKTLVSVFYPLPSRAEYFEKKIQNMVYTPSSPDSLNCDYEHIICEHPERFPVSFFKNNCEENFLTIDNISIDDIAQMPAESEKAKEYFKSLGCKIKNNLHVYNRLKDRIANAVDLAEKRAAWNYKTAIPMYYPNKNKCSLLLPLSLDNPDHVDLALVVEPLSSGAYQGQTVLPLSFAYSNSRLITRPDSDWLRTSAIVLNNSDKCDESD